MIKAVIFDFDNTLMDFMKVKRAAVSSAVDAMIDAGLTMNKNEMIEKIYSVYWKEGIEDQHIFDKVLQQEFGQIDYKILAAGIIGYRRAKEGSMCLYPHVQLTLTSLLKMGISMVVVSDAPRLPVWMRICSFGLQHLFDYVFTYEDVGEKKPSPKPFRMALRKLNLCAESVLMVGDIIERDIEGAKKLGIKTVFAKYGNESNIQKSGADYEIDDIIELIDIIKKENNIKNNVKIKTELQ